MILYPSFLYNPPFSFERKRIINIVLSMMPDNVDWNDVDQIRDFDKQLHYVRPCLGQRIIDIVFATISLVGTVPIFLTVIIVNWVQARSAFVVEKRSGENKTKFNLIKFRVYKKNVRDNAKQIKDLENNDTMTTIGILLNKTYMDELPQLINILKGDMSLVGPRPWPIFMTKQAKEKGLRHKSLARPGLTGPYQAYKGIDSVNDNQKEAEYRYIYEQQNRNCLGRIFYDLYLIIITVRVVIKAEGY